MATTILVPSFGDVRLVYKGKVIYEGRVEAIANAVSSHDKLMKWVDSHDGDGRKDDDNEQA